MQAHHRRPSIETYQKKIDEYSETEGDIESDESKVDGQKPSAAPMLVSASHSGGVPTNPCPCGAGRSR